jgi:hypothetical protein
MNLIDLKKNAVNVAYQLRKNFTDDESMVSHYVCENEVVIISTKNLYIFYCDRFTDYKNDILSNIVVSNVNLDSFTCSILLQKRLFNLEFPSKKDLEYLLKYIVKFK